MKEEDAILIPSGATWEAKSLSQIQPVVVPLVFKRVFVSNRTKTCRVLLSAENGELQILVTNYEEDEKFRFEKEKPAET